MPACTRSFTVLFPHPTCEILTPWVHCAKVCHTQHHPRQQVRDAVKAGLLQAALLEAEEDEAAVYSLLAVTTGRHNKALAPLWERAAAAMDGDGGGEAAAAVQKLAAAVGAAPAGDARFRAYVGVVLGLINWAAKVRNGPHGTAAFFAIRAGLCLRCNGCRCMHA